jgi:hypothetical protein
MIAQKTVIIPAADNSGVFVLQLNADGTEDQMSTMMDATSVIDEKTTTRPESKANHAPDGANGAAPSGGMTRVAPDGGRRSRIDRPSPRGNPEEHSGPDNRWAVGGGRRGVQPG